MHLRWGLWPPQEYSFSIALALLEGAENEETLVRLKKKPKVRGLLPSSSL